MKIIFHLNENVIIFSMKTQSMTLLDLIGHLLSCLMPHIFLIIHILYHRFLIRKVSSFIFDYISFYILFDFVIYFEHLIKKEEHN
jgi:hypothetical protein